MKKTNSLHTSRRTHTATTILVSRKQGEVQVCTTKKVLASRDPQCDDIIDTNDVPQEKELVLRGCKENQEMNDAPQVNVLVLIGYKKKPRKEKID